MRIYLFCLFIFTYITSYSQVFNSSFFNYPVKIPVLFSSNFGELRANHFHSGVDIKTQGKIGVPIYSAADGKIVRISVSSSGFGLALYIDHPNGTTTVYGHLDKFRDDIQQYIRNIQYKRESFNVDISVPPETFQVAKGDLIAYGGNSGSSAGPHLHFEVRDTKTQTPVNPLLNYYSFNDNIPPEIEAVMFYPTSDDSHVLGKTIPQRKEVIKRNGKYQFRDSTALYAFGEIGFGIQTVDYLSGSNNKCGVYEIYLYDNDNLTYQFRMNHFSFDDTRYLNSHIDYAQYNNYKRLIHKTWVEPGNKLKLYPYLHNNGKTLLSDRQTHIIKFVIRDVAGNESIMEFPLISRQMDVVRETKVGLPLKHDVLFGIVNEEIDAKMPAGSFYSSFLFDYQRFESDSTCFSPIFQLHNAEVPVHNSYDLKIKTVNLPEKLKSKAVIAVIDPRTGKKLSVGGTEENGWIKASVRQLGSFTVSVDTIPPQIRPVNIQNKSEKVSFRITDNFTGIRSYRGEIDGKWALFEYDAKNNLIEYYFDPSRIQPNTNHRLKLTVVDGKENRSVYETSFFK